MDNKYAGMTVNERLYVSGLLDAFDEAISKKNTKGVISILKEVELTDANIKPILDKHNLSWWRVMRKKQQQNQQLDPVVKTSGDGVDAQGTQGHP